MPETQETQIEHFPDRSLRRLLQDAEYVRGLVRIIAPDIEAFLDFSRITYQKRSFIKELEAMAQTTAEFLREQGKAEGKVEGKQDTVLKFLQLQFQSVSEVLSREIRNIHNLSHLDTLLEQAMTAQSLEEIDTHLS